MKNIVNKIYNNTEKILFYDKIKSPKEIIDIVEGEVIFVLKQYFDLQENSFKSALHVEKDGYININFSLKAKRMLIKQIGLQE